MRNLPNYPVNRPVKGARPDTLRPCMSFEHVVLTSHRNPRNRSNRSGANSRFWGVGATQDTHPKATECQRTSSKKASAGSTDGTPNQPAV